MKLEKKVGYVAAGAGAMLLMVLSTINTEAPSQAAYHSRWEGLVVYVDGHDGVVKTPVLPPAQPVAVTEPIYSGVHNNIPPLAYCGRADDTGRWWGICLSPGKRSSSWIGPPPLEPCTMEVQRLRRMQGGYGCSQNLTSLAGWYGTWRGEARP